MVTWNKVRLGSRISTDWLGLDRALITTATDTAAVKVRTTLSCATSNLFKPSLLQYMKRMHCNCRGKNRCTWRSHPAILSRFPQFSSQSSRARSWIVSASKYFFFNYHEHNSFTSSPPILQLFRLGIVNHERARFELETKFPCI